MMVPERYNRTLCVVCVVSKRDAALALSTNVVCGGLCVC